MLRADAVVAAAHPPVSAVLFSRVEASTVTVDPDQADTQPPTWAEARLKVVPMMVTVEPESEAAAPPLAPHEVVLTKEQLDRLTELFAIPATPPPSPAHMESLILN